MQSIVSSLNEDKTLTKRNRDKLLKKKLCQVRDAILDLTVIMVKLDNQDDAYLIFETLNTRGKDLSLTDLVKNHLTKHLIAKSTSLDQAKEKWQSILQVIEGSSVDLTTDGFLHHFWLSKYDYLPAKRIFKVLKKQVVQNKAKAFLDDLVADAKLYRAMHEVAYGRWTKQERRIQDALRALMLFRVRQQTPCVLSLYREYKAGKIKKRHFEEAIVAIEKFHFFFTAVTSQRSL